MPQTAEEPHKRLYHLLKQSLPNHRIRTWQTLEGGITNLNLRIHLENLNDTFVLRRYLRNPAACEKEVALLQQLDKHLPVPQVLAADPSGRQTGEPFILYRYLEGITFRQLRAHGSPQDTAQAAHAIGAALAHLQTIAIEPGNIPGLRPRPTSTEDTLRAPLLRQRLGPEDSALLQQLFLTWKQQLLSLDQAHSLVHGDFNHRNVIVNQTNGHWHLAGILDWEMACTGSSLWDVARFLCYEKTSAPCCEPHLSTGFRGNKGSLPSNWTTFARVINTISAAESLRRADLQVQFIPELIQLVHRGVRGQPLA